MTARLPSLNGLRAFEAAARHLSFTVAASELAYWKALAEQRRREHGRKFAEEMERNARGSGLANY